MLNNDVELMMDEVINVNEGSNIEVNNTEEGNEIEEIGTIPFFLIDDDYGIAADKLCYMLVRRAEGTKTGDDGESVKIYRWTSIAYLKDIPGCVREYMELKIRGKNRKLVKSKDFKDLLSVEKEVVDHINSVFTNKNKNELLNITEVIQMKEKLKGELEGIRELKEKLLRAYNEFEEMLKEKRRIIIGQTEPKKHRYKEEE